MQLLEKLNILSAAAKYDVSCSSSGSSRKGDGFGNAASSGICHSWTDDGRCVSLLKILFSNCCIYDCAYCISRRSNDIPRATFTVDEMVNLTVEFYRRNYIEGLFLSSAVFISPDRTMEALIRVIKKLRTEHMFGGYIHVKAIPGASQDLIREAGMYADRMSVNIELPSEPSLAKLAPEKKKESILKPMSYIGTMYEAARTERRKSRKAPRFVPAGQSTQLVIGASPESDRQILHLSQALYKRFRLRRVYYSAFARVNDDSRLPSVEKPPLLREHRLYQADWLVRFYKFDADEILTPDAPFLDERWDPKTAWALRHLQFFPVEVNIATYEQLLRVPGVGVKSAKRITATRRHAALRPEDLPRLGLVMKRARFFLTCGGRPLEPLARDPSRIADLMMPGAHPPKPAMFRENPQLEFPGLI